MHRPRLRAARAGLWREGGGTYLRPGQLPPVHPAPEETTGQPTPAPSIPAAEAALLPKGLGQSSPWGTRRGPSTYLHLLLHLRHLPLQGPPLLLTDNAHVGIQLPQGRQVTRVKAQANCPGGCLPCFPGTVSAPPAQQGQQGSPSCLGVHTTPGDQNLSNRPCSLGAAGHQGSEAELTLFPPAPLPPDSRTMRPRD